MGEVYRARDTKLGRDVAIKVLPVLLAADPDRLARFEREARTLASLNHPNIAQIYGALDLSSGEAGHHWPHVLPGNTHLLFTLEVDGKSYSEAQIVLASVDGTDRRVLIAGGTDAR